MMPSCEEFVKSNLESAYQMLVCQKCEDYCHPPFQRCDFSHMICNICFDMEKDCCEVCGGYQCGATIREKVHSLLDFLCKYSNTGCSFIGKWSDLLTHHELCPHFVTECPDTDCIWEGKVHQLFDHYLIAHPNKTIIDEEYYRWINEINWEKGSLLIKNIIECVNRVFLVFIIISPLRDTVRFVATNFGPLEDIEEFYLVVEFILKDGSKWTARPTFCKSPVELKEGDPILFTEMICYDIENFRVSTNPNMAYDMMITIGKLSGEFV